MRRMGCGRGAMVIGAAIVVALSGCSSADEGDGTPTATVTPTGGATATQPTQTTTAITDPAPPATATGSELAALVDRIQAGRLNASVRESFVAEEAGVFCAMTGPVIGCELMDGDRIPAPPGVCADGAASGIGRIVLGDADPEPQCNTDTIVDPDAPRLGTGERVRSVSTTVACLAEAEQVSCFDQVSQTGFVLGSGRYEVVTD